MTAGAGMLSCVIGVDIRCDAALGTIIIEAGEHFKGIVSSHTMNHLQLVIPLSTHLPEASTKNNDFHENKFHGEHFEQMPMIHRPLRRNDSRNSLPNLHARFSLERSLPGFHN